MELPLLPPLPITAVPIELPAGFLWSAALEKSSQNDLLLSSKLLPPPPEGTDL